MENIDSQDKRGPVEEFYTDAHADFNASFEDALLLERFEVAQAQLEDFKSKNGESALYLYRHGEKRNPSSTDCSHLISKITSEAKIYVQEISINEINANSADFFPATSPIDFSTPASAALKISEFIFPEIPYEVENVGLRSTSEYSSSKSGWYYYVALRPKLNIVSESNVELPDCPSTVSLIVLFCNIMKILR